MLNTYIPFTALFMAILSLWLPTKHKILPWSLFFVLSLLLALISGIANYIAVSVLILFYGLVFSYQQSHKIYRLITALLVFILGLALELHLIPGFHNPLILHKIQFTPDAIPFTLYLNLDKTAVGLIIIGLTLTRIDSLSLWQQTIRQVFYRLPIVLLIIMLLSFLFGYVKFEMKFPEQLWIWILSNLFFTCLAEEGLFRGFLQKSLNDIPWKSKYLSLPLILPAIIFGLLHYQGGIKYVFLATFAGILYGWVYQKTKRIEASILTHFLLNLTHILFFTYPALSS